MKTLYMLVVLLVPCVVFGWPGHWVLALAAFGAGWLAAARPYLRPYVQRPGYLPAPRAAADTDLTRRVAAYTTDDVHDGIGL